jgi:transcriptional regulator with XRE-family HTH domain
MSTGKINVAETFSGRLRGIRLKMGYTKAQMARNLGFSPQRYHRYETGRVPDATVVSAIAAATGLSTDCLLGREPIAAAEMPPAGAVIKEARAYPAAGAIQSPLCRFPADCDLVARLDRMETQMQTLVQLLGATLAASSPATAPAERKKAG